MTPKKIPGYDLYPLTDWKDRLSSIAAYIKRLETAQALHLRIHGFDAKIRIDQIAGYIGDLEYCLSKSGAQNSYYENLIKNYDRLVAVAIRLFKCNQTAIK
jgi:hypothetical protein